MDNDQDKCNDKIDSNDVDSDGFLTDQYFEKVEVIAVLNVLKKERPILSIFQKLLTKKKNLCIITS